MIVGILGNAGVGKSTASYAIVSAFPDVRPMGFADPMKAFVEDVFDFTIEQVWGDKESKEKPDPRYGGLTPRVALAKLGTEWGRSLWPTIWVEYAMRLATPILSAGGHVVIHDCRFPNEVEAIKKVGGKVIRLRRPGYGGGAHASEAEQATIPDSECDAVIDNNGTIEDLNRLVVDVVRNWIGAAPKE